MTRTSGKTISVPDNVKINVTENDIEIQGPRGFLNCKKNKSISIQKTNNCIIVNSDENSKLVKSLLGTYRSLLSNMIYGVTSGYEKKLLIVGVGYKVSVENNILNLNIGYSHQINYEAPNGITIQTPNATEILIRGIDKQKVGQTAAEIRAYRKPEPYKGKGIRYDNEVITLKETKKK